MTEMSTTTTTTTTMRTKTNPMGPPTFHQSVGTFHICMEAADLKRLTIGASVVFPVHARPVQAGFGLPD